MPDDIESSKLTTREPEAKITRELVQPPARVYMTLNDRLYIRSRNSLTGVVLRIAGRLLTAQGEIIPFNFDHTPNTDRTVAIQSFQLAEGYLLSAVVFPVVGAPLRGQTFVELGFLRGIGAAADIVDVLAKDYVAEDEPLAFPGSPIRSMLEGPGRVFALTGADPAAGDEVVETVPANVRWRVMSVRFSLVADATVANRTPALILTDGTNTLSRTNIHAAQTASQTRAYNFYLLGHGETAGASNSEFNNNLPENLLVAGFTIETVTGNIQAGDNFGTPFLLIEEWIED